MKENWNSWTNRKGVAPVEYTDYNNEVQKGYGIRGNGRSYGDACLNDRITSMLKYRNVLQIENGILKVSSGFLLREALEICVQKGFFIPVIPGTQFVTIGGMIAADVHGKNHSKNGTIGRWIKSFHLRLPSNEVIVCSSEQNTQLFNATIGGMGLTGVILEAEILLEDLKGTRLKQHCNAPSNLRQLLHELEKDDNDFAIGWMDCLNDNRVLLFSANFENPSFPCEDFKLNKAKWNVPNWNVKWISTYFMKLYNQRYFKKSLQLDGASQSISDFFFPLDAIRNWNRIYGEKGFYQYQFVVNISNALVCIERVQAFFNEHKIPIYLCVIKKHGDLSSPGLLSFPFNGFSIAVDVPYEEGLIEKMQMLDGLIIPFGGRVYLAKDGHLSSRSFELMYSRSAEYKSILASINKGQIISTLAKRLNLIQ